MKRQAKTGTYLQHIYITKDLLPGYINKSCNSLKKRHIIQLKTAPKFKENCHNYKRFTNGQQTHGKIFKHQGNANWNHETTLHNHYNG